MFISHLRSRLSFVSCSTCVLGLHSTCYCTVVLMHKIRQVFRTGQQRCASTSQKQTTYHSEPSGPKVVTEIPGPKSKQLTQELSRIQVNCLPNITTLHVHNSSDENEAMITFITHKGVCLFLPCISKDTKLNTNKQKLLPFRA